MTFGHLSVLFSPRNSYRDKEGSSRVSPVSLSHLVVKRGKVVQAEKKKETFAFWSSWGIVVGSVKAILS